MGESHNQNLCLKPSHYRNYFVPKKLPFFADGKKIATAETSIRIGDTESGKELQKLEDERTTSS